MYFSSRRYKIRPLPPPLLVKLHAKTSSQNHVATMARADKLKYEQSTLLKDDD